MEKLSIFNLNRLLKKNISKTSAYVYVLVEGSSDWPVNGFFLENMMAIFMNHRNLGFSEFPQIHYAAY